MLLPVVNAELKEQNLNSADVKSDKSHASPPKSRANSASADSAAA